MSRLLKEILIALVVGILSFIIHKKTNEYYKFENTLSKMTIIYDDSTKNKLLDQVALTKELNIGYRVSERNSKYLPCKVQGENGGVKKAKIKLKGGGAHYKKKNKSFRIKLKKGGNIFGVNSFSIQQPGARGYLIEWMLHRLLKHVQLLSLRFELINVKIDNKESLYSFEEHMGRELLINNAKKIGPIFHFENDMLWEARSIFGIGSEYEDQFNLSPIVPYNLKTLIKDDNKFNLFKKASSKLENFRRRKEDVKDVFNINDMAKLMALMDLFGPRIHYTGLTNLKFYFNPNSQKIEPICYDQGYISTGYNNYPIIGAHRSITKDTIKNEYFPGWLHYIDRFFEDKTFYELYAQYLNEFSKEEFLNIFLSKIMTEFQEAERIIRLLDYNSNYSIFTTITKHLYQNQEDIQTSLNQKIQISAKLLPNSGKKNIIELKNHYLLPIDIIEIKYNGKTVVNEIKYLNPKSRNYKQSYNRFFVEDITESEFDPKQLEIKLNVIGSKEMKTVNCQPFNPKTWDDLKSDFFYDYLRKAFTEKDEKKKVVNSKLFVKSYLKEWNEEKNYMEIEFVNLNYDSIQILNINVEGDVLFPSSAGSNIIAPNDRNLPLKYDVCSFPFLSKFNKSKKRQQELKLVFKNLRTNKKYVSIIYPWSINNEDTYAVEPEENASEKLFTNLNLDSSSVLSKNTLQFYFLLNFILYYIVLFPWISFTPLIFTLFIITILRLRK